MIPFDERWIHQLEKQYGSKHPWERPSMYRIAIDDGLAPARQLINDFFEHCPQEMQHRLLPRVRSDSLFWDTYHEIVVGDMLRRSGKAPEYEHLLAPGLSPDWYVSSDGHVPGCYIEVFSYNLPPMKDTPFLVELAFRVSTIPVCSWITVAPSTGPQINQTRETAKQDSLLIQRWLTKGDWEQGQSRATEAFVFRLERLFGRPGHVTVTRKSIASFINSRRLRSEIQAKAHKYGEACWTAGCALLIAIFPNPFFGPDLEDAEVIALGRAMGYGTDAQHVSPTTLRDRSGLFTPDGPLSGLVWLTQQGGDWSSRILLNGQAHIHPPDAVLKAFDTTASSSLQRSVGDLPLT
jgi:hypothetical protein